MLSNEDIRTKSRGVWWTLVPSYSFQSHSNYLESKQICSGHPLSISVRTHITIWVSKNLFHPWNIPVLFNYMLVHPFLAFIYLAPHCVFIELLMIIHLFCLQISAKKIYVSLTRQSMSLVKGNSGNLKLFFSISKIKLCIFKHDFTLYSSPIKKFCSLWIFILWNHVLFE